MTARIATRLAIRKTVSHLTTMKPKRGSATYSRISVKSQTVLPKQIREALGVLPGDTLRYRITEQGVLLDKARPPADADDPFATFSEWRSAADEDAYGDL